MATSDVVTLSELTLAAFVEAVGEDRPSPGCGGAAAVALALAASCARKAFGISARHRGGHADLERATERCRMLSQAAIVGVQRDAANFEAWLKSPEDQPALALEGDAQVLMALAEELRSLVHRYGEDVDKRLAGDLTASLALTEAFERIQTANLLDM